MKTGFEIDWSTLQAPEDDGAARHLTGLKVPSLGLPQPLAEPSTCPPLPVSLSFTSIP